jgi:hypothetical protein
MRYLPLGCFVVFALDASVSGQDLRRGLVAADAVVVARQVAKVAHDDDVTLHTLQVLLDVRGGGGATSVVVLDWPRLALHQRPTLRQSRLYCLTDASRNAAQLGLPPANGPYFKMVGFAGSNPLVGADLDKDPIVGFARLLAAAEAGAPPADTARATAAAALGADLTVRLEAARHLAEMPTLRGRLDGVQWSAFVARAVGETEDLTYKSALAELCAEQRLDGLFDALLVGLSETPDVAYARTVGRIGKALHGEDAANRLLTRLQQVGQRERRAPLLVALGATNTAAALDALLRMDRAEPAVVDGLRAHRDPRAVAAVAAAERTTGKSPK